MYYKSSDGWLKHFDFILLDLLCLQAAYAMAYSFRHGLSNPYLNPLYRNMAVFLFLADIAIIFFFETFTGVLKRGYYRELNVTVKHVLLLEMMTALYLVSIQEGEEYSRTTLYLTGVFYACLTYAVRLLWKMVLKRRVNEAGERSMLIVTSSSIAKTVVENIQADNYGSFHLAGLVLTDRDKTGEIIGGLPVVSGVDGVAEYICQEWVDEVLLILSPEEELSMDLIERIAETGVTVHQHLAKTAETIGKKQFVERIGSYTVLTTSMNYATPRQAFMKRSLDILGGMVGCMLTVVIYLFIAPAIYLQSPGPIFFSQTRVGKNGKLFKIYKFRSMYMDAEERKKELMKYNRVEDGFMFKMDFDPRIIGNRILPDGTRKTGIGEFIRRTSLDEFPQFWNVLKGEMSLVGTRPPLEAEVAHYEGHHKARLAVKPGITGLWQVSGRSEIVDFDEVVKLDTKYINEWSMGLDLRILLKTVLVVFKGEGAM